MALVASCGGCDFLDEDLRTVGTSRQKSRILCLVPPPVKRPALDPNGRKFRSSSRLYVCQLTTEASLSRW